MANKVVKFIKTCCSLPENPILSIMTKGREEWLIVLEN